MKKFTLVMASFGLAMLAACGDDSSSGAETPNKDSQGRTIYNDMQEALEAPCSEANKCEVIIMNDPIAQDTLQCNGSNFMSMISGPVKGCAAEPASSADEGLTPASSADVEPVAESSSATVPAESSASTEYVCEIYTLSDAVSCTCDESRLGKLSYNYDSNVELVCILDDYLNKYGWVKKVEETSSASEEAASSASVEPASSAFVEPASSASVEPVSGDDQGPTGDLVSCEVTVEGVFGEHSCIEAAADNAAVSQLCASVAAMGPDMHMTATAGTSCNASATALKCVKNGMNFYSLDGKQTDCATFLSDTMLSSLAK